MSRFDEKINEICRLFTEAIDPENNLDAHFVIERLLSTYAKNVWWPNVKPILELCERKLEVGQQYHSERHDVFITVTRVNIEINYGDSFRTVSICPLTGKADIWGDRPYTGKYVIGAAFSVQNISDALTIMDWSMQYLNEVRDELELMEGGAE